MANDISKIKLPDNSVVNLVDKTSGYKKTDENVKQEASSGNYNYEVLLAGTSSTSTETTTARKSTGLKFNPSTSNLSVTKINGVTVGDNPKFTDTTYSAGTGLSLSDTTFNHSNSVTAGTASGDASKTLTWGGTFTIPSVTYDAQGHITQKGTTTMTMPANPNSDIKVRQSLAANTDNTNRPLLLGYSATTDTTANVDNLAYRNNSIYANPSTGTITATKLVGDISGGTGLTQTQVTTALGYTPVNDASYVHTDNNFTTTLKNKLDGIATGAEVNQNAFSNVGVKVGSTTTTVAADSKTDTVTLIQGDNVTLTADTTNDTVTIAAKDTTYSEATTSAAGLMSATDKTKLNGIATGAEVNQNAFSNIKVGSTTVAADAKTDTLELVGSNVTLAPDATNDKVTIELTQSNVTGALGYTPYDSTNPSGYTSNTGTVTSVTINTASGTPITVNSTSAITTSGTRTITHSNSGVTAGTYRSVTVNATGHVTAGTNPTTLSGYGITDAKIASGVITLGSNTIKPATLDADGKVPTSQLPSYVDDVLEYASQSDFPATGETGKIYIALDTNKTYRWSGTTYVEISASLALGETSSTAYRGDRGKVAYDHATDSSRLTTAKTSGFYKIATTSEGHVASVTAVAKSDITGLGIPGSDTNYYHTTGSWSGLTYTATANGGAGALAFTLPTGSTATTVAAGNHTHATSIAADSGTSQLAMTANTKYKLTAGGTTYIFTTPVDTTYESKAAASGGTAVSLVTTGEKYTWNSKADGTHTHTLSLAADTGTSSISLAANSKYKLTAGGSTYVFTTPTDNNTTYTFANGTNGFTVTPLGGTAQTVTVTPSIANNVTGSGTSGYLTKWNGANTVTNGPALGSSTTTYLRNDGTWATPANTDTNVTQAVLSDSAAVWRKVALGNSYSNSEGATASEVTSIEYVSNALEYQNSTGTLNSTKFRVNHAANIEYNTATQSLDFVFT